MKTNLRMIFLIQEEIMMKMMKTTIVEMGMKVLKVDDNVIVDDKNETYYNDTN